MSTKPIIVWLRADLRVHDHPALWQAVQDAEVVVPVFIVDENQLRGPSASANRNRFLIDCLEDLRASLQERGGDLIVRSGKASEELLKLAKETEAGSVYYVDDFTPYAQKRANRVSRELEKNGVELKGFAGKLMIDSLDSLKTKSGSPYKVFTPFFNAWRQLHRREVAPTPRTITLSSNIQPGALPSLKDYVKESELSPDVVRGGERAARQRLHKFLDSDVQKYHEQNNLLAENATSGLSPYLHFGCVSVREIETMLGDSDGEAAWRRQLAWRDFYYYILYHFGHPEREFQERYHGLAWERSDTLLHAWKEGQTGYPVVDAAMRQLKQEGWMHNRGRLIVGSFLTKDLGIDWREGEKHFMRWLVDGDLANNNGNWQWIASVGVDPAPLFRRLYNPSSQRDTYDPDGSYVRRYVPELQNVPDEYLSQPWTMPEDIQKETGCVISSDYPAPVVDHAEARQLTMERYKNNG